MQKRRGPPVSLSCPIISPIKMNQCVPLWDLDDNTAPPKLSHRSHSNSSAPDVPMLDYEVAELTWENGQLAMHGLGPPRVPAKPTTSTSPSKYTWEKPRAGGTLESIVNQATRLRQTKPPFNGCGAEDFVPWFNHNRASSGSATMTTDALVPCSNRTDKQDRSAHVIESVPGGLGTWGMGSSTHVGSCSGPTATQKEDGLVNGKSRRVARVPVAPDYSGREHSVSHSATFGRDNSQYTTHDKCNRNVGVLFTSSSFGSQENTSSGKLFTKTPTADENDSVCHSRPQKDAGEDEEDKKKGNGKSSVSTKRSRAAAIHNQSERKRRDKINQRMKTLQKLVPNSSKTDKASMLDEVIEYLKQLQAQVQMMNRMNMQSMMLPITMQQQLQMSMIAPMSMGMGMGMGMGVMDMNAIGRSNIAGIPPVLHPSAFMPMASWDGSSDRLPAASATVMPDPLSAFLACQSQKPMTMDAYSRMAAMYQLLQQQLPASSSKT